MEVFVKEREMREQIFNKGYSLKEFAEIVDVNISYMSLIINGKRRPSAKVAKRIAIQLEKDVSDLFEFVNKEDSDNAKNKTTTTAD